MRHGAGVIDSWLDAAHRRALPRKVRPVVMGPASRFACAGRRRWIWFVVIASVAKQSIGTSATKLDCFAALAMTVVATAGKHPQLSFPDVQLHIVDAPLGAGPESITTDGGYGVRARCCASPRNDGLVVLLWR